MNWSELPKEYQGLENEFKEGADVYEDEDNIAMRFIWVNTPQDWEFWLLCHRAASITDLPKI